MGGSAFWGLSIGGAAAFWGLSILGSLSIFRGQHFGVVQDFGGLSSAAASPPPLPTHQIFVLRREFPPHAASSIPKPWKNPWRESHKPLEDTEVTIPCTGLCCSDATSRCPLCPPVPPPRSPPPPQKNAARHAAALIRCLIPASH